MLPLLWAALRAYAPYLVLPVAATIGVIGYNLENILSDKYTPFKPSIEEQRDERLLGEISNVSSEQINLHEKKFVPKSIFETNMSPQLRK